jgi:hypothetical protein
MKNIITIYCEGKKGSHDFDILEKVVGDIATIRPIGGKKGANAIIEFSESGTVKSDFYCMFRDRDFDCPVPENEELTFDGNKTFFSYRTTIENYLFDTELFFNFVKSGIDNIQQYSINDIDDVKNIFIEIAKSIKDYQAVRHTLGKLRFPNSFDTTWVESGSGHLPESLDLDYCKTNGWRLINDIVTRNNTEWTENKFLTELEIFLEKFNEDFFEDLGFLIYFQGKDFAKALTNKLVNFPLASYYKFSKTHFDYKKYKDLLELRKKIEYEKKN